MNMRRATVLGLLSVLLIAPASVLAQVTMAEIQADYDGQKYQEVVRKTGVALNLRGNAAVGMDRAQLQVLRGESYLRLKQNPNAATAFTGAAKDSSDSTKAGLYAATATLITKSPGGKYTAKQALPGGTKPGPIDITEEAGRKEAFAALFNDELKTVKPRIDAQTRQQGLNPLVAGMKLAGDLRNLEVAATGKDDTVKAIIDELGGKASTMMAEEIRKMSTEVERISAQANQTLTDGYMNPQTGAAQINTQKRGLTTTDSRTLTTVVNTTAQITKACDELAVAVGSDRLFSAVKEDSARLSQRAYDVLNTNYAGSGNIQINRGRQGGYPRGN